MDSGDCAPAEVPHKQYPPADWPRQVVAIVLGPGLLYWYMIHKAVSSSEGEWLSSTATTFTLGSLFYVGLGGGWLLLLLIYVSRDRLTSLNRKPGSVLSDVGMGFALLFFLLLTTSSGHSPGEDISGAQAEMGTLAHSNHLAWLAMFPYSWLAGAVFEEFNRTFMLSRLLKLARGPIWSAFCVLLSASLFGACHLYYGFIGAWCMAIFGGIMAGFYLNRGRVLPMIIAHGLYGTLALVGLALSQAPGAGK